MTDSLAVGDGSVVEVHYTLKDSMGTTLDKSEGEPLLYLHGTGQIVAGLERALIGKVAGDAFTEVVQPEDGYGRRTEQPQAVPRSAFPATAKLERGEQFLTRNPAGQPQPIWIAGVSGDTVFVDFNHPLAGQTLHFDVVVVSVRAATAEEKAHGHAHGAHGHHHH